MRTQVPALIAILALSVSVLNGQTSVPSLNPPSKDIQSASPLSKSAENGNASAQAKLGLAYITGSNEPKDYAQALFWLNKAAQQGNAFGEANLGYMFLNGWGVAQNYEQALVWLTKSAAQGDALGENNLAAMYEHGWGVATNDVEAVKWYRRAAEQGLAAAQDNLGHMYRHGIGVTEDDTKAVEWYRRAADQGFAQGENDLGAMYANGLGAPEDNVEAVKWLRKAADQGNEDAQNNLQLIEERATPERGTSTLNTDRSTTASSEAMAEVRTPPPVDPAMPKPRIPSISSISAAAHSDQSATIQASAPRAQTKDTDMTVFGLQLGEKFSIPECKREQVKGALGDMFPYSFGFESTPFICFQRGDVRTTKPNAPVGTDEVGILLPDKDTPLGVMYHVVATENNRRAAIVAQIVDGNIEAVTIYTMGIRFQDVVLAMLKGKYGESSSFEEENKENSFGAVFSSHLAKWSQFTNLTVIFEGALDRTDIGSIDIMTIKGANYLVEKAEQKTQARPKL
jgi:TPR repeat protein